MGNYNFRKDLKESEEDMRVITQFLISKGASNIEENHDKNYDLSFSMNNENYTVEIKHDHMYRDTGNVAIELISRGKLSGISSSKATMWCYILGTEIYFCNTEKLRTFINRKNLKVVTGGDNKTSTLVLVPLKDFKSVFTYKGNVV
jgi:hypothetical protein